MIYVPQSVDGKMKSPVDQSIEYSFRLKCHSYEHNQLRRSAPFARGAAHVVCRTISPKLSSFDLDTISKRLHKGAGWCHLVGCGN